MPHPRRLALPTFAVAILTLVAGPAAARPFTDAAGRVVEVPNRAT
ncbi:iron ABC transporter substrate-binding protein, partial [Methylobacterium sp. WL122]